MRWSDFREEFHLRFPHLTEKETAKQKTMVQPNSVQKNGANEVDTDEDPHIELESAEMWLKHKMVLSEDEAYGISQTVNG
jgi:adenosine deaminase CECR1